MGKNDTCCAKTCTSRRSKHPELQFYRLPKDTALRKKWTRAIGRKHLVITDNTRLCSKHFIGGKRSLDETSPSYCPSIFRPSITRTEVKRKTRNSAKSELIPPLDYSRKNRKSKFKVSHVFSFMKSFDELFSFRVIAVI